ncbi:MAG: FtsW/RodA/SpoVE family cell cycle protein [Clostridia bacterium]|nr:FtsW/RodA/SpoVE family cell cycle protein [Clostridia bacterium]
MSKIEKMRKALMRTNTRLLLTAVMAFQCISMVLLAFRTNPIDTQALLLAAAMPVLTGLTVGLLGKLWPLDRAILILSLLLASIGIITLTAIARSPITPRTHAIYAAAGLFAMCVGIMMMRSIRDWRRFMLPLAFICIVMLVSPWIIGQEKNGARNWISIIPNQLTIQPSEFMKPVLIVVLAAGLSNRPRFVRCLPVLAFAALCCGILLSEKDLGALLLYFLTTVFMYYAATSNALLTLAGLGMGCGAAVIAYHAFEYVRDRIAIWQNPWTDPEKTGYQLIQSLIAIGSGGLFGMGLGLGSPRNVPLYHSDFIFASISEEFGLICAVCVLAVYVLIILRGLMTAMNARTSFHSLTAFGIVVLLGLQTMLIVGGNTKLLPLTGVTLPLVSYGGSSLVSTFFSIGMLLGISSMNAEDETKDIDQLALKEELAL